MKKYLSLLFLTLSTVHNMSPSSTAFNQWPYGDAFCRTLSSISWPEYFKTLTRQSKTTPIDGWDFSFYTDKNGIVQGFTASPPADFQSQYNIKSLQLTASSKTTIEYGFANYFVAVNSGSNQAVKLPAETAALQANSRGLLTGAFLKPSDFVALKSDNNQYGHCLFNIQFTNLEKYIGQPAANITALTSTTPLSLKVVSPSAINAPIDDNNTTQLMQAVRNAGRKTDQASLNPINYLIINGAIQSAALCTKDTQESPILIATQNNNTPIIWIFIPHNGSTTAIPATGYAILKTAANQSKTPYDIAKSNGNSTIVGRFDAVFKHQKIAVQSTTIPVKSGGDPIALPNGQTFDTIRLFSNGAVWTYLKGIDTTLAGSDEQTQTVIKNINNFSVAQVLTNPNVDVNNLYIAQTDGTAKIIKSFTNFSSIQSGAYITDKPTPLQMILTSIQYPLIPQQNSKKNSYLTNFVQRSMSVWDHVGALYSFGLSLEGEKAKYDHRHPTTIRVIEIPSRTSNGIPSGQYLRIYGSPATTEKSATPGQLCIALCSTPLNTSSKGLVPDSKALYDDIMNNCKNYVTSTLKSTVTVELNGYNITLTGLDKVMCCDWGSRENQIIVACTKAGDSPAVQSPAPSSDLDVKLSNTPFNQWPFGDAFCKTLSSISWPEYFKTLTRQSKTTPIDGWDFSFYTDKNGIVQGFTASPPASFQSQYNIKSLQLTASSKTTIEYGFANYFVAVNSGSNQAVKLPTETAALQPNSRGLLTGAFLKPSDFVALKSDNNQYGHCLFNIQFTNLEKYIGQPAANITALTSTAPLSLKVVSPWAINAPIDSNNTTQLMKAVQAAGQNTDAFSLNPINYLVINGAIQSACMYTRDKQESPLLIAAQNDNLSIINIFIPQNGSTTAIPNEAYAILQTTTDRVTSPYSVAKSNDNNGILDRFHAVFNYQKIATKSVRISIEKGKYPILLSNGQLCDEIRLFENGSIWTYYKGFDTTLLPANLPENQKTITRINTVNPGKATEPITSPYLKEIFVDVYGGLTNNKGEKTNINCSDLVAMIRDRRSAFDAWGTNSFISGGPNTQNAVKSAVKNANATAPESKETTEKKPEDQLGGGTPTTTKTDKTPESPDTNIPSATSKGAPATPAMATATNSAPKAYVVPNKFIQDTRDKNISTIAFPCSTIKDANYTYVVGKAGGIRMIQIAGTSANFIGNGNFLNIYIIYDKKNQFYAEMTNRAVQEQDVRTDSAFKTYAGMCVSCGLGSADAITTIPLCDSKDVITTTLTLTNLPTFFTTWAAVNKWTNEQKKANIIGITLK